MGSAGLQLFISDLSATVNVASAGSLIDWSTVAGLGFTLADTSPLYVSADFGLNIGSGLVVAAGSVEFSRVAGALDGIWAGLDSGAVGQGYASLFVGSAAR